MRPVPRRRRQSGLLLIEVMISMLLLLVCAAGSLALLNSVFFATGYAGSAQTATRLGQDLIDRSMLEPFANVGNAGSNCAGVAQVVYSDESDGTVASTTAGRTVPYTRTCTMSTIATGPGTGMKIMRVLVTFQDSGGKTRTIRLGGQRAP